VKSQFVGGLVVLPSGVERTDVEMEGGRITAIGKLSKDLHAVRMNLEGKYLLPGFIDIHANGIAGFDLTNGVFDPSTRKFCSKKDEYLRGLDKALRAFAQRGTTLVGATILEASVAQLTKILSHIAEYRKGSTSAHSAALYGVYIEGVFIKERRFCGAHNPRFFQAPSVRLFNQFQRAADGNIRIVNVVPEWGKAASTLIAYLSSRGIVCAAGHSGATGDQYRAAIDKGSTLAIHLLNGPSSSSSKPFHGGGVLEVALQSDRVYAEIIADGYHVDKAYVLDIVKRKGIDKSVLVTDSMFAATMTGIREFEIAGIKGKVSKSGRYLSIADRNDALYGSVLTMDQAFQNMLNWFMKPLPGTWNRLHKACTFEEALWKTSHMCSTSPAKALGVFMASSRRLENNLSYGTGQIAPGKRADLVVADIHRKRRSVALTVEKVIVNGAVVGMSQSSFGSPERGSHAS
jgi:N-acetylglucosamine-6-phosphate deacetylase